MHHVTFRETTNLYRDIIRAAMYLIKRNYRRVRKLYRVNIEEGQRHIFPFLQRLQALRLENKEKRFLAKQSQTGNRYNVFRNISTQADLRDSDGDTQITDVEIVKLCLTGEIHLRLEITDFGICLYRLNKGEDEIKDKTTQTESLPLCLTSSVRDKMRRRKNSLIIA